MYQVSKEYKDYLQDTFLNTWWESQLEVGAINRQAQKHAIIKKDENIIEYSTTDIFDQPQTDSYASYELNRTKADGAFKFIGKNHEACGIVSKALSDENGNINTTIQIELTIEIPLSIKGITLIFGEDAYAVDFMICDKHDNVLLRVTENHQKTYINDLVYIFDSPLMLKISKISKPYYRFRLSNIMFGMMLRFHSNRIISMSFKEQLNLISTEMYTADLTVTVDNNDNAYDVEIPSSEIHFLEEAQRVEASVSLSLPNGKKESIPLGILFLTGWSSNLSTAEFIARDRFSFMNDIYDKDIYHEDGITLYELAKAVLQDAGIKEDEYLLDVYLREITVKNPIPAVTHKEALQLIANAGRCILKQDRCGRIMMKSSFIPDVQIKSDNKSECSDMNLSFSEKDLYASYEKDLIKADGKSYFWPGERITGYVSLSLSQDNCVYENPPYIEICLEAPANMFALNIFFGSSIASDFTITTYLEQQSVETLEFANNNQQCFNLQHPFKECNRIMIMFKKAVKPYQRVYVSAVTFDTTTDKKISFNDILQNSLEGVKTDTVKQLTMIRTIYTPEALITESEIKITKLAGDARETIISFNDPMYDAILLMDEVNCGYAQSAWRIKADLDVPLKGTKEYALKLIGRKLIQVKQPIAFILNTTGRIVTMENPLISDECLLKEVGDWIKDYLKSDREYEYTYMHGDPSLDSNDIIQQESSVIENLQTQIYSHELTVAGAITGKIKGRKVIQ